MPDISSDKTTAATYPPETLYYSWSQHADSLNMSTSQFIVRMIEAGRKKIDVEAISEGTSQELRQQRSDLQNELQRQRDRVRKLEKQLHYTAQSDILNFTEANPGATAPEIIQHVANTVPERVASHLDLLEGDLLERNNDGYRLSDDETDGGRRSPALKADSPTETES